jgi:hypothetical protein
MKVGSSAAAVIAAGLKEGDLVVIPEKAGIQDFHAFLAFRRLPRT